MQSLTSFGKLLTAFLLFIASLILFRVLYSQTWMYVFMGWNIFLAWLPYVLSTHLKFYRNKQRWKQVFLLGSWLLFFPNALYIVTDLVHLRDESTMPWWYDAMLLFAAAFAGLLMAFVSLRNVERYLSAILPKRLLQSTVFALLFLGSYGVYLGRFERFNSWNIVNNPAELGLNIFTTILNPLDNFKVWAITILFTAVYALLYYSLRMLPKAFAENNNAGQ
ncbi:MAG: DUF1361 domain-containing protein [Chitinophagaceae bacterium]|nr:MAG: DUF1361 domain-containing protein [Chitinophagaceae bacterium]